MGRVHYKLSLCIYADLTGFQNLSGLRDTHFVILNEVRNLQKNEIHLFIETTKAESGYICTIKK